MKSKKFWMIFGPSTAVFLLLSYLLLIRPALEVVSAAQATKIEGDKLQKAFSSQDIITANKEMDAVGTKLDVTRKKFDYFGWTSWIPWVGDYYRDGRHVIIAGDYGIQAGKIITTSLLPFADVLGLNGKGDGTAADKLQKVVEVMPKIAPQTDAVAAKMKLVDAELSTINPNRYPDKIAGIEPKKSIKDGKDLVKLVSDFMPQAKNVLTYAPNGLGSPNPKTYMVIFQNDKELRPSGGFLTAYTFATLNKGRVTTTNTDDIYNLDVSITAKPIAPAPILKYLPLVPKWNLRDTNLSPDFKVSMDSFEAMYRKSPRYQSNNGYIGVDTYFLQSLLRLTGPVKTASTGDTFTAENVVPKMETYAEQVFRNAPNRKGFLGELMKEVMSRITKAKSDQWSGIITAVITSFNEKHIMLVSKDADVQNLIETYDWGGRIKDTKDDYLHINDSNFAGAKANLYIKEKITQEITIKDDGTVSKKVNVEVVNPVKDDGFLNGPYRDWVRMYVPKGSNMTATDGGEVKTSTTPDELNKTMFENFFIARPLGFSTSNKASWSVTYTLPNKVTGHQYKMLVQKQPGVDGPDMVIKINGQTKVTEQLRADKEYDLSF